MNSDCVEIELELGDKEIEAVQRHMERSGLDFNDAIIELLEMGIDEYEAKKVQGLKIDAVP